MSDIQLVIRAGMGKPAHSPVIAARIPLICPAQLIPDDSNTIKY